MHDVVNRTLAQHIVTERRISLTAKSIHHLMRFHPKMSIKNIASIVGVSMETARRHIKELERHGWMYRFKRDGKGDTLYVPWMPLAIEKLLAENVEWLLENVSRKGERLMCSILDLIVDETVFIDNTRLKGLVSVLSGYRLEYDRLYWDAKLAVEFQGRQHFEEVQFADGRSNLQAQQQRDGLKMLGSEQLKITLVQIADIELSPELLIEKLEPHVALIPPRVDGPLYETLQRLCHGYRQWAISERTNS